MIGKIYRPLKILGSPDRTSFHIDHKYFSNFGGDYLFSQDILLLKGDNLSSERVVVSFDSLDIDIIFDRKGKKKLFQMDYDENSTIIGDTSLVDSVKEKTTSLIEITNSTKSRYSRKMKRPAVLTSKLGLIFNILITPLDYDSEGDIIQMHLDLTIKDEKEFLMLTVVSDIEVEVISDNSHIIHM